ncbi:MAG: aminotransferase class V-fold PLP-dependent enzyme [Lachnospiraceae bacterium]|nr:aminotransferase class V-fold PLP-dependent enzyme [Ruminococcus sp.]MCM1275591.1 aminotransferase class V-fold PLP-dependent enzyme [Lachnospiraceae bacterium]
MIYLDNAATTFPKPQAVYRKWARAMSAYGANPGRSGHALSQSTAEAVYQSREKCAEFFGAEPENTVFTLNCTHALNFAIKGIAKRGCHFVTSDMEHNAVIRPVYAAARAVGGSFTMFEAVEDEEQTVYNAERAVRPNTVALVCTAAGNVTGLRTPLKELAALCRRKRICFIVDAAQGAGTLPITLKDGINIICAAGHKGLYGPMGTGLMMTDGSYPLNTLMEGGTGSASESVLQPDFSPDRFESGTINTAGVIALGEGVDFVRGLTTERILAHELALCRRFCEGAEKIHGIRLCNRITMRNSGLYAPVVSFNIRDMPSTEGAAMLSANGFAMRGGLHCAPLAHKKIGTINGGTIRFSPSAFNTAREVDMLLRTLEKTALR